MKKLTLVAVVGTRPEIIRLSRVLAVADEVFELILVHTGQNYDYELNEIFFQDLGVKRPDHFLEAAGKNANLIRQHLIYQPMLLVDAPGPASGEFVL